MATRLVRLVLYNSLQIVIVTDSIQPVETTAFALMSSHVFTLVRFEVLFSKLEGMAVLREPPWPVW